MKRENVLAADARKCQFIGGMSKGMVWAEEERLIVIGNHSLRIVLGRFRGIYTLRDQLAHFIVREGRMQERVADQLEAKVEVFLEEFAVIVVAEEYWSPKP